MKRTILLLFVLSLIAKVALTQVAINETGNTADSSAILDISSSNKGMLVPRMTSINRTSIQNPVDGLLVFDITTNSFWYYNGMDQEWQQVGNSVAGANEINDLIDAKTDNSSVYIGKYSGDFDTLPNSANTSFGKYSLQKNTNGTGNTAVGYMASRYSSGGFNVAVGYEAGYYNADGNKNTLLGFQAGRGASSHDIHGNVFIGFQAGYNEDGDSLLYIENSNSETPLIGGDFANDSLFFNGVVRITGGNPGTGKILTSDDNGNATWEFNDKASVINDLDDAIYDGSSLFVGEGAGINDDATANANTAIGKEALSGNINGKFNTACGYQSLINNKGGANNTGTGTYSLYSNVSGSNNTATGFNSQASSTSAKNNTSIGSLSMADNNSGEDNTAVGYNTLLNNQSGSGNTAIGARTLESNKGNSRNTAIGFESMRYADSRKTGINSENTAVGFQALMGSTTPANNTGTSNTAIGSSTLKENTTGFANTALGINALSANRTASYNTATGSNALTSNTTGWNNTANGTNALYSNISGENNVGVGEEALFSNTDGDDNTAVGREALATNIHGFSNTAIGRKSLYKSKGDDNTAVGYLSLSKTTTGYKNIALGSEALKNNTIGFENVAIGYQTLNAATGASYNIAIGSLALTEIKSGWGGNTAIGYRALTSLVSGGNNVALGEWAGTNSVINDTNSYSQSTFLGAHTIIDQDRVNITLLGYGINDAECTGDNQVLLGNTAITEIRAAVAGITAYSDKRFKTNIMENVSGLDFVLKLKPVTYSSDPTRLYEIWETPDSLYNKIDFSDTQNRRYIGFLAQDVEKAAIESNFDFPGIDIPRNDKEVYSLRYTDFVPVLVKAIQEQAKEIILLKQQKEQLEKMNAEIELLKTEMIKLQKQSSQINNN
jgi:hypothetical protein